MKHGYDRFFGLTFALMGWLLFIPGRAPGDLTFVQAQADGVAGWSGPDWVA